MLLTKSFALRHVPWMLLATLSLQSHAQSEDTSVRNLIEAHYAGSGVDRIEVNYDADAIPSPCEAMNMTLPRPPSSNGGRVAIQIQCQNLPGFRFLTVQVDVYAQVVQAARGIEPASVIAYGDIEKVSVALSDQPANVLRDTEHAIGASARRRIVQGQTLTDAMLRPTWVVQRNDQVTIQAQGTGFSISRSGIALEHGAVGQSIRVKMDNGQILSALVEGQGILRASL